MELYRAADTTGAIHVKCIRGYFRLVYRWLRQHVEKPNVECSCISDSDPDIIRIRSPSKTFKL